MLPNILPSGLVELNSKPIKRPICVIKVYIQSKFENSYIQNMKDLFFLFLLLFFLAYISLLFNMIAWASNSTSWEKLL